MKAWWYGLSASERRTLGIGGFSLAVIMGYFMIWQPIQQTTVDLQQQLREQQALLAWMQPTVAEIRAAGGGVAAQPASADGASGQALFALADQSARQAGLGPVLQRVEPSGQGGARVTFEKVGFDELMGWLASLRDRYGISVSQFSMRQGELRGRVNAQISLETPEA